MLDGRLELVSIGSDRAIWTDVQTSRNSSTWSGWTSLGVGGSINDPAVGLDGRRLEIFIDPGGPFQTSRQITPGGPWSAWTALG